ncbi:MAG: Ig-like domain-containing protein [Bacilli bacterium]
MKTKNTLLLILILCLGFLLTACKDPDDDDPIIEDPTATISVASNTVSLKKEATHQIVATVANSQTTLEVAYSSSNTAVATVSESGLITGIAKGTAVITVSLKLYPNIKATVNVTITEEDDPIIVPPIPNMMGQDFVIMVNKASTADPRSESFVGSWKEEKVALIDAAEKKYNVKVVYKTYPADAVWGGGRERFITTNSVNNTPQAHIYEMPSYSIAVLAEGGAILPLDALIEKYGNEGYWPEKAAFGTVLGKQYGYDDAYPLAGQGIFYNIDLLETYLGEGKGTLPSDLWMEGKWDWEAFETICNQLLPGISGLNIEDAAVIGGRPYNWAYFMLGANGVHVVSSDLKSELATQPGIDTLTYLNELVSVPGMWEYESAALSNATCPQFKGGNIAFHNGEPYWMYDSTKWLGYTFNMGFVPYPVGPNVSPDLSNYYINEVYGKTSYLVSSSYSLDLVPPGYENIAFHEETIFRIWADMQYFPDIDPETGYVSTDEIVEEWVFNTLELYYSDANDYVSIEAHKQIMFKGYPDYFYSLYWARSQDETKSFMLEIQKAILSGSIRDEMLDLVSRIHQEFIDTYVNLGLTADHYN